MARQMTLCEYEHTQHVWEADKHDLSMQGWECAAEEQQHGAPDDGSGAAARGQPAWQAPLLEPPGCSSPLQHQAAAKRGCWR